MMLVRTSQCVHAHIALIGVLLDDTPSFGTLFEPVGEERPTTHVPTCPTVAC
jgi:hypothetical protein